MKTIILTALVAVFAGASVGAHHSYSNYHMDRIVEFSGILEEFESRAPHSLIKVRTDEGKLVVAEWLAPFGLTRSNVDPTLMKKGDLVVLSGNPHRDFDANGILNFKSVTRPADGLKWEVPVRTPVRTS